MNYERIKVVEYLEPSMSKELLVKFPDNSAFDFDYTQSSIWSPLVTRAYSPSNDMDFDLDFIEPKKKIKKIDHGNESFSLKKINSNMKKKMGNNASGFSVNLSAVKFKNSKKKMKKKKSVSDLSPGSSGSFTNTCNPVTKTVWNKVLKAASKHFKKKKRDSTAHVRLSNSMANEKNW